MQMDNSDKTSRSIFVGNIPYEATEEKLMTLFGQAGPVIGFRLVYDRESGKPKGYGFCEYNSTEIAHSALRNLNNIDFNGRPLRIGPAAGEQNSAEVAMNNNASMKPPQESPYGEKVEPNQACVTISQAVASLPPEQLYQLMVEMKQFVRDHPMEARQSLLQNPQLAYALLQCQVIMKITDPKVAISMLRHTADQIPRNPNDMMLPPSDMSGSLPQPNMTSSAGQSTSVPPPIFLPPQHQQPFQPNHSIDMNGMPHNVPPHPMNHHMPMHPGGPGMPPPMPPNISMQSPMPPHFNQFPVSSSSNIPNMPNIPPNLPYNHITPKVEETTTDLSNDLSDTQKEEARNMMKMFDSQGEKDKAALIFQVLSLTDEQVAMLPEDQRKSIEVLKAQLKHE